MAEETKWKLQSFGGTQNPWTQTFSYRKYQRLIELSLYMFSKISQGPMFMVVIVDTFEANNVLPH